MRPMLMWANLSLMVFMHFLLSLSPLSPFCDRRSSFRFTSGTSIRIQYFHSDLWSGPMSLQSCVKTFLLNSENHPPNVPLPTPKMHCNPQFQPVFPETGEKLFFHYTVWELQCFATFCALLTCPLKFSKQHVTRIMKSPQESNVLCGCNIA